MNLGLGDFHEMMGFDAMGEYEGPLGGGYSDFEDSDEYNDGMDQSTDYDEEHEGTAQIKLLEKHIYKGYLHRMDDNDPTYNPMFHRNSKVLKTVKLSDGFIDTDSEKDVIYTSQDRYGKTVSGEQTDVEMMGKEDEMTVDSDEDDEELTTASLQLTKLHLAHDHKLPKGVILPVNYEPIYVCSQSSSSDLIIKCRVDQSSENSLISKFINLQNSQTTCTPEQNPTKLTNDTEIDFFAIPVHIDFLKKTSPYFENMLNQDRWNDSVSEKIGDIPMLELKFESNALISLLKWLYSNEFTLNMRKHQDLCDGIELYKLCDELCLTQCREILEKFFKCAAKNVCFRHLFRPNISIIPRDDCDQIQIKETSFDRQRVQKDLDVFMHLVTLANGVYNLSKTFEKYVYSEPLARLFLDDQYSEWLVTDADAKSQLHLMPGTVLIGAFKSVIKHVEGTANMYADEIEILDIDSYYYDVMQKDEFLKTFREKWTGMKNLLKVVEEWMNGQEVHNDYMKAEVFGNFPWACFTDKHFNDFCKNRKSLAYYCESFEKSMESVMEFYLPELRLMITNGQFNMNTKKSKQLVVYKVGFQKDLSKLLSAENEFELGEDFAFFREIREEINTKLAMIENNTLTVLQEEGIKVTKRIEQIRQTMKRLRVDQQQIENSSTSKLTKFSVPIVDDYGIYNGNLSHVHGYNIRGFGTPLMFSSRFNMYEADQLDPVIVQAVDKNDLETLQKMINHAKQLPEFNVNLMSFNPKESDRQANKVHHTDFIFRQQALDASGITTEIAYKTWEWYSDTALHRAVRTGNDRAVKLLLAAGADPTLQTGYYDGKSQTPIELVKKPITNYRVDLSDYELSKNKIKNIENMLTTCLVFWDESDYAGAKAGGRKNWDNTCFDLKKMKEALELTVAMCDWTTDGTKDNEEPMNADQICKFALNSSVSNLPKKPNTIYCRCYNEGAAKCTTKSCLLCCQDKSCVRHQETL